MKKILLPLLAVFLPVLMTAQITFLGYAEYGYSLWNYKSEEIGVFFNAYNTYQQSAGLTKGFGKLGPAKGDYLKFGLGFGGENTQMIIDFGILKAKTEPVEARFSDNSGRDIVVEQRNSNTNIGVRFGGSKEIPVWAQLNLNLGIQATTIHSIYVFPDGSRSFGADHSLNGSYDNFIITGGPGVTLGCRIIGPVNLCVTADYFFNGGRKQPEYHQFEDLNEFKGTNEFLPRDMNEYVNNPWNMTGNSISNDMRGFRFAFGIQVKFSSSQD